MPLFSVEPATVFHPTARASTGCSVVHRINHRGSVMLLIYVRLRFGAVVHMMPE